MTRRPISDSLRRVVIDRARNRCEYCRLAQEGQEATFHVDHVIPLVRGGSSDADNLALACVSCSLRKGARQRAIDPQTDQDVRLFNPRQDRWEEHFAWTEDVWLIGRTPTGRATVEALALNRPLIRSIRRAEMALGRHPPS